MKSAEFTKKQIDPIVHYCTIEFTIEFTMEFTVESTIESTIVANCSMLFWKL